MPISNQQKSKKAVEKLLIWIDSDPQIPVYNGRINKAAICKQLKITRSTVSSNPGLKEIFEKIESKLRDYKQEHYVGSNEKDLRNIISQLEEKLSAAQAEILSLKRRILADEFLIHTGRAIL